MQDLIDRTEVTDLISRLGVVLDEARFEDMPALLAEDVSVHTPGGTAAGREAVIAQASRNHRPEQPIQHVITNVLVDLGGAGDSDRAQARANLVVHFGPLDGGSDAAGLQAPPVESTLGEVYRFGLVRTPDGWRFSRIETTAVWTSGKPIRPPRADG